MGAAAAAVMAVVFRSSCFLVFFPQLSRCCLAFVSYPEPDLPLCMLYAPVTGWRSPVALIKIHENKL